MDFKKISELLNKYKDIIPSEKTIKEAIISVFSKFGVDLKKENIKMNRDVVYINSDFTTKSKLFVNKLEIMRELKNVLGKKTPKDII